MKKTTGQELSDNTLNSISGGNKLQANVNVPDDNSYGSQLATNAGLDGIQLSTKADKILFESQKLKNVAGLSGTDQVSHSKAELDAGDIKPKGKAGEALGDIGEAAEIIAEV